MLSSDNITETLEKVRESFPYFDVEARDLDSIRPRIVANFRCAITVVMAHDLKSYTYIHTEHGTQRLYLQYYRDRATNARRYSFTVHPPTCYNYHSIEDQVRVVDCYLMSRITHTNKLFGLNITIDDVLGVK